jgi:PST family polysaccharide transporter
MNTMATIPNAILMKEMKFKRLIFPGILGPLSNILIAILLATLGFGFWSLTIGKITESFIVLVLTVTLCGNYSWLKPKKWNYSLAKILFKFGITNSVTGLIQFIYNYGGNFVIGKLLGAADLGLYTRAYTISNMPTDNLTAATNTVLFPAYTKIRNDAGRLANGFVKAFITLSIAICPIAIGLLLVSNDMIVVLIGEKWREAGPILAILSLVSLVRPLSATTFPVFLAIKKPGFGLITSIIQCISVIIFILIFKDLGTIGIALAVVCTFSAGFLSNLFLVRYKSGLRIRIKDLLNGVAPVLISTIIMSVIVLLVKYVFLTVLGSSENLVSLLSQICFGAVSYCVVLFFIDKELFLELIKLLFNKIDRRKERNIV